MGELREKRRQEGRSRRKLEGKAHDGREWRKIVRLRNCGHPITDGPSLPKKGCVRKKDILDS